MVWVKIETGIDMVGPARNFATGIILPRATPAWSGTTHSISSILRAASHARASSSEATPRVRAGAGPIFFFLATIHLNALRAPFREPTRDRVCHTMILLKCQDNRQMRGRKAGRIGAENACKSRRIMTPRRPGRKRRPSSNKVNPMKMLLLGSCLHFHGSRRQRLRGRRRQGRQRLQLVGLHRSDRCSTTSPRKPASRSSTTSTTTTRSSRPSCSPAAPATTSSCRPTPTCRAQIKAGTLLPSSTSRSCPTSANMWPVITERLATYDPGNEYAVDYMWGTTGIGYNVDKIKAAPAATRRSIPGTWSSSPRYVVEAQGLRHLRPRFAGGRDPGGAQLSRPRSGLEGSGRHREGRRAADQAIRPYIRKFHSSEYINALANGDICLALGYSGDVLQARDRAEEAKNGVKIDYVDPEGRAR